MVLVGVEQLRAARREDARERKRCEPGERLMTALEGFEAWNLAALQVPSFGMERGRRRGRTGMSEKTDGMQDESRIKMDKKFGV
jgi:hypothetical protein